MPTQLFSFFGGQGREGGKQQGSDRVLERRREAWGLSFEQAGMDEHWSNLAVTVISAALSSDISHIY